jgi:thiamine-phosphate pyrophosphorylase
MIKNNFINIARSISFNKGRSKILKGNNKQKLPYIWMFTDSIKTSKPVKLTKSLPTKSGVVIRHYNSKNKETIIRNILNIKKRKNLTVLISGKYRRNLNVDGNHLPKWLNCNNKIHKMVSISVHTARDIRKSINVKADLVFISSVFPSSSHKSKQHLGIIKLGLLARLFKKDVIALGGINNKNIARLRSLPISGCAGIDVFTDNLQ